VKCAEEVRRQAGRSGPAEGLEDQRAPIALGNRSPLPPLRAAPPTPLLQSAQRRISRRPHFPQAAFPAGRATHQFGSLTRSASVCAWRSSAVLVSATSLICASVRCLMNTGLPRHLTVMTCAREALGSGAWRVKTWAAARMSHQQMLGCYIPGPGSRS
jgi:hypothetical protein